MQIINRGSLRYYQFDQLCDQAGLLHGIFTRLGGISRVPFEGLNTSLNVGDDPRAVVSNRHLIADCLPGADMIFAHQVHGERVVLVQDSAPVREADALVTDRHHRALVIQLADCQSVMLYDPCKQVVANIHSGWRGSIANIAERTVALMHTRFGCRAADILAGVSPSLGPCCAEFVHFQREIPEPLWDFKDHRDHFDFWQITHFQLTQAGLLPEHVEIAGLCTKCHQDLFYSYRGARVTGRFATAICRVNGQGAIQG